LPGARNAPSSPSSWRDRQASLPGHGLGIGRPPSPASCVAAGVRATERVSLVQPRAGLLKVAAVDRYGQTWHAASPSCRHHRHAGRIPHSGRPLAGSSATTASSSAWATSIAPQPSALQKAHPEVMQRSVNRAWDSGR